MGKVLGNRFRFEIGPAFSPANIARLFQWLRQPLAVLDQRYGGVLDRLGSRTHF